MSITGFRGFRKSSLPPGRSFSDGKGVDYIKIEDVIINIKVNSQAVKQAVDSVLSEVSKIEDKAAELVPTNIKLLKRAVYDANAENAKAVKEQLRAEIEMSEKQLDNLRRQADAKKGISGTGDTGAADYGEKLLNERLETLRALSDKLAEKFTASVAGQKTSAAEAVRENEYGVSAEQWLKSELDKLKAMFGTRSDNTDYQAIINSSQKLREDAIAVFDGLPKKLSDALSSVGKIQDDAALKRANKESGIDATYTDASIKEVTERMERLKLADGMTMRDGNVFNFGAEEQAALVFEKFEKISQAISQYEEIYKNELSGMNDTEKKHYDSLVAQRADCDMELYELGVKAIKERQKQDEQAAAQAIKTAEKSNTELIALAKQKNAELIEEAKVRRDAEIKAVEEASVAGIESYENRIKEIERLLQAYEREYRDEDLLDKTLRVKEQLKYEIDESNRYELQKEIDQLEETYERNQRKDSLNDEKAYLREEISVARDAVKEKTEALKEAYVKEVALLEDMHAAYVAKLDKDLEGFRLNQEMVQEQLQAAYDAEYRLYTGLQEKKTDRTEKDERNRRDIINSTSGSIISDLYARVWEFAEAGRRAGEEYARAYAAAASGNNPGGDEYATNNTITVNNTYNVPVASPSRLAAEQKSQLESMARYL